MTLESSLPYLSLGAAAAALWAAGKPPGSAEPALKAFAFAALAMFAYFRRAAPAAVAEALILAAVAQALAPRGEARWRTAGLAFLIGSWLVFAYLFFKTGTAQLAFLDDPAKAMLLLAVLAAAGWSLWRTRRSRPACWRGALAAEAALAVTAVTVLTLRWSFWPAMAGVAVTAAAEAVLLAPVLAGDQVDHPRARLLAWTGSYLGLAAVAYAFLG